MAKMDDLELQSIVAAEIADSTSFIDNDIGPLRAQAVDYYFGRPFGNEEEGRSSVVSRDVHDTIQAIMPSLMRIFFGSENVVEFVPEGAKDIKTAEQATDYVNYVITQDNPGFEIFYSVIKNALREKVGFAKYWWDEKVSITTKRYNGLDMDQITQLLEDVESSEKADLLESETVDGLVNVKIRFTRKHNRVQVIDIPPEEFLISRDARSIDGARLVAHRCMKTVSELVAMGYDRDLVENQSQDGDDLQNIQERMARNPWMDNFNAGPSSDASQRLVLYVEAYPLVDYDGDGIAELRKVCTIGPGFEVILNEECDERPFADFQCDPEPHTFFGQSLSDKTMDIQRVKSNVWRASLDSLSQSIFPRTVVTEGDGYMEDAMNTEVGAILRSRKGAGYNTLDTPFVGEAAFPMLTYMDEVRENRTGMSKVSQGLDAEALQNTTATAAQGQFTRSQDRIDLVARIMASGMRRLFRGVLKLLIENQTEGRNVKLRTGWEDIDPRTWRTNMDVICSVGLGGGSDRDKSILLSMVAQKQEQIFLEAGFQNPLVTPKQYYNTLSALVQLGGFRDPDKFITDPDSPEAKARQAAIGQQPPKPDPKMAMAQADIARKDAAAKAQADLDQQKAVSDHTLRQQQLQADTEAAATAAARQHEIAVMTAQANIDLRRQQTASELEIKRGQIAAELDLKEKSLAADAVLEAHANELDAEVAHHDVDAQADVTSDVHPGGEPG